MSVSAPAPALDTTGSGVQPVPLWRNMQFQTLWLSQAVSSLGSGVANVAYPLAILALTGSPARAGLFAAIQIAGMLVGALPGGQLADLHDRRTIVVITELGQAVVTVAVAVGLIMGWISLPELLTAAALLGVGAAIAGAARMPLVRSVVPSSQLTAALTQDEVRQNGAALAGPPLAGALYGIRALAHAVPFLFTAASFVLSAVAAVAMTLLPAGPDHGAAGAAQPAAGGADAEAGDANPADADAAAAEAAAARRRDGGMLAGLRVLWASPVLRAAMLLIMIANTIGAGLDLAIIVILRDQHVHTGLIGVVLAAAAVGGLAGAPLVKPLHRIRPGVLLLGFCLLDVPILAGMALPFGPWWLASLLLIESLPIPAFRVLVDVLILRQTPDEMRGRVVAAVMTLIGLGMPAGVVVTGLLLQTLSAKTAILTLAGAWALGALYCATKRELWRARWPQQH